VANEGKHEGAAIRSYWIIVCQTRFNDHSDYWIVVKQAAKKNWRIKTRKTRNKRGEVPVGHALGEGEDHVRREKKVNNDLVWERPGHPGG